jgi:hypothetical protein
LVHIVIQGIHLYRIWGWSDPCKDHRACVYVWTNIAVNPFPENSRIRKETPHKGYTKTAITIGQRRTRKPRTEKKNWQINFLIAAFRCIWIIEEVKLWENAKKNIIRSLKTLKKHLLVYIYMCLAFLC